jgi:hypothetical protein
MNAKSLKSDRTETAPRLVQQKRVMYRVEAGAVLAAVVLGAALGCNAVLGIDDATLCGGRSCDGGLPTSVEEDTQANLPGERANPPTPNGSDAAAPPANPLGNEGLGAPADVPLAPSENPADNSSAGSGSGNSGSGNSGSGNGNGNGNSGSGNGNSGGGNGNGNDDPPPDDAPTTPPPTTPPPTTPPPPPPPPSPCEGRSDGEAFCNGLNRIACGPGGTVTSTLTCPSAEHCAQATGLPCAACLTGEASCNGAALSVCNADQSGFDILACAGPQFCNAAPASCTPPACQPNEVLCDGAFLQICNATLTGFDLIADCGAAAACNASTASCNLCTPGTSRCLDLTTVATCDATGQAEVVSGCPLFQTCESGDCQLLGGL